jgi:phosphodiesterase/alkaline phosphatase D-like protein
MDSFTEDNIFSRVKKDKPDVWVWLGDATYMDEQTMEDLKQNSFILFLRLDYFLTAPLLKSFIKPLGFFKKALAPVAKEAEYYREKFDKVRNFPNYADLARITKVVGVWDDHDMGLDNVGSEFAGKDVTRDLFLDFIDEPADSERRL